MFLTLEPTNLVKFEDRKIKYNFTVTFMQICLTEEKNRKYFAGRGGGKMRREVKWKQGCNFPTLQFVLNVCGIQNIVYF